MKKSLWMLVVAMVVGWGMSSTAAVTGAVFSAWSFETLSANPVTVIPSTGDSSLPYPYDTWSASSNNDDLAYVTNVTVPSLGFGHPIAGSHDKVLYFNTTEGVTNHYDIYKLNAQRFYTDFLLNPGQLEEETLLANVDNDARLAFFIDTNGYFNLLHGKHSDANWVTSTFANVVYGSNDWLRITIDQDYFVTPSFGGTPIGTKSVFSIYVNGTNLTHSQGYTREDDEFTSGGGTWFVIKNAITDSQYGMNALVAMGVGMLDDVVNATTMPDFGGGEPEPDVIGILAMSENTALGTISPAGFMDITNESPRTFTLSVSNGLAVYVSGLKLDNTQVYTNDTDEELTSTNWVVTYAMVEEHGTNVVALFAAKPSTTMAWLLNSFTIGGEGADYATYEEAVSDDWDEDGFTNGEEAIAGTDPKDAEDFLQITGITVDSEGKVVVTFKGKTGGAQVPYELLEADDVVGPYSNVANRAKAGGDLSATNTPATSPKFYKINIPYSGQ